MDFMTSRASFGSAAATPGAHVCARHADVLAPRFCLGCGAPLCSACARSRPHRECPECAVSAGRAPLVADLGWYVSLLVDGAVHAAGAFPRRTLPVVALLTVGATLAFFLLPDAPRKNDEEIWSIVLAFGAFSAASGLATWVQPALELPLRVRPSFGARVGHAMLAGVVPALLISVAIAGLFTLSALAMGLHDVIGAITMIVVGMGGSALVVFGLGPALVPVQAAAALRRTPPLRALKLPFSGGAVAYLQLVFAHFLIHTTVGSIVYALLFPLALGMAVAPVVVGVFFVALTLVGLSGYLSMQGAYGTASLRYLEDCVRVRAMTRG